MRIIEKTTTPKGIEIQLEDWTDKNTTEYPDLYGLMIGAYPIAKNSSVWVKAGETFRLTISHNECSNYTNDNVKSDFEALKSGEKSLEDLASNFWYGEKDMWYLGMLENYR